jgi:hypothetical protein
MSARAAVERVARRGRVLPAPASRERQIDYVEARMRTMLRPLILDLLDGEIQRARADVRAEDRAVKAACKAVADACDALDQAMYSRDEISARHKVARAAARLRDTMRKHGRWPE